MSTKRVPFFAYRYLVTNQSLQTTIIQQINKSKEELFKEVVDGISADTKTEWKRGEKRYLIYGFQNKSNINIIKFARESNENIYIEGEVDIEIKGIKEAKYVYIIIDTKHQIILIENNRSVFQEISTSVNIITDFFQKKMKEFDYVINIYPLSSKYKFWNYIESADELFELSLEMNSPNMPFFGNGETREILKILRESTNNETVEISIQNKQGKLKIIKETFGKYIDYVREVGGRYKLIFSKNGIKETTTSDTDTSMTYLPRKKEEKYTDEEIDNISQKLISIHKLETREDESEN
jgi:hypothetical protein